MIDQEPRERRAIVTGGGSGIGKATAQALARNDWLAAIIGRTEAKLEQTVQETGEQIRWFRANVSARTEVKRVVETIVDEFEEIDLLVNNAGFSLAVSTDMCLEEAEKNWDEQVGANLKGAFLTTMAVVPHLTRPGGRIVNVSSIAAFTGGSRAGAIGYAASKAGLHGLTYGLARELSPLGITVNAVAPGFITETDFFGEEGPSDERVAAIVEETPVGRPGRPEEVAAAVLYLASTQASFVTGEILSVNGGWLFGR